MYSETDGFCVTQPVLDHANIQRLSNSLSRSTHINNMLYASRNLLQHNEDVRALAVHSKIFGLARNVLGPSVRAVKATFFDKTKNANWKVPPHQDVTIAVKQRVEVEDFTAWTVKGGITNVQPPAEILSQMIALRIHLDYTDENNGALKVWPGSHQHGRLFDQGIDKWISSNKATICPIRPGAIMLMRPLLIHASSPAVSPTHRRVIHIEYASCNLPGGLEWLDTLR